MGQKSYANLSYTVSRHKAFNGITAFQTSCIVLNWLLLFNQGGGGRGVRTKKILFLEKFFILGCPAKVDPKML